jgi:aminoglycoside/choline kinase family phosphotransferase
MKHSMRRIRAFVKRAGIACARDASIECIAGGGSDRWFFRIRSGRAAWVVMAAPSFRNDIRTYVDVSRYLSAQGVAVPELLACDDERQLVLMEDLGSLSLLEALRREPDRSKVLGLYRRVLAFHADLVARATPAMHTSLYLRHRSFGYESFRWETDYFKECFLKRFCGMPLENETALDGDFHRLAETLAAEPRRFMHRDFQSQNIFLTRGRVRIVDFQTATRGLVQYDLAALLKDAYFLLQPDEQDALARACCRYLRSAGVPADDEDRFVDVFHRAGLQRSMQALGAFAFLGKDKGKTSFLQYIPAGLHLLQTGIARCPEYPVLAETVHSVRRRLDAADSA